MNNNLRACSALLSSLFLIVFASCSENYVTTSGNTWGTSYHITYQGKTALQDSIIQVLKHIDTELSMFNSSSTVSRINRGELSSVTPDFKAVFDLALKVNIASGGRFDPTVAPLVDLWGFGKRDIRHTPLNAEVEEVLPSVGIADCHIDSCGTLVKKNKNTEFDFSSIAKGFGIDCVGAMLERNGVDNYMVEIGGEVLVRGYNPNGLPWHIQIDSPYQSQNMLHSRLSIIELGPEQTAVATSGNYRNYRQDEDGNRYGHTISPITGYPADTKILSVTIEAPSCALADALATACMMMDSTEISSMVSPFGARALVVVE